MTRGGKEKMFIILFGPTVLVTHWGNRAMHGRIANQRSRECCEMSASRREAKGSNDMIEELRQKYEDLAARASELRRFL